MSIVIGTFKVILQDTFYTYFNGRLCHNNVIYYVGVIDDKTYNDFSIGGIVQCTRGQS